MCVALAVCGAGGPGGRSTLVLFFFHSSTSRFLSSFRLSAQLFELWLTNCYCSRNKNWLVGFFFPSLFIFFYYFSFSAGCLLFDEQPVPPPTCSSQVKWLCLYIPSVFSRLRQFLFPAVDSSTPRSLCLCERAAKKHERRPATECRLQSCLLLKSSMRKRGAP